MVKVFPKVKDMMHAFKSVFYGLTSQRNIEKKVLQQNPVWIKQFPKVTRNVRS